MGKTPIILVAGFVAAAFYMAMAMLLPSPPKNIAAAERAYLNQIAIEGLFTGRGTAGEQVGLPLVWFRLRNKGNKAVREVRVRLAFIGRDGTIVHEVDLYPVGQASGFGRSVKPLEPGELWQMSEIRFFMPSGVPHTWDVGKAKASVESVRFVAD